jgi:hypothetical protein
MAQFIVFLYHLLLVLHELLDGLHHLLVVREKPFDLTFFVCELRLQFEILVYYLLQFLDGLRWDFAFFLLCLEEFCGADCGDVLGRIASWRRVYGHVIFYNVAIWRTKKNRMLMDNC